MYNMLSGSDSEKRQVCMVSIPILGPGTDSMTRHIPTDSVKTSVRLKSTYSEQRVNFLDMFFEIDLIVSSADIDGNLFIPFSRWKFFHRNFGKKNRDIRCVFSVSLSFVNPVNLRTPYAILSKNPELFQQKQCFKRMLLLYFVC